MIIKNWIFIQADSIEWKKSKSLRLTLLVNGHIYSQIVWQRLTTVTKKGVLPRRQPNRGSIPQILLPSSTGTARRHSRSDRMPRQCDPLLLLPSNAVSARGMAPFRDRTREHHSLDNQARWPRWVQDSWRIRFHSTNQVYLIIHSSYSIYFLLSSRDFIELLFFSHFSHSLDKK